MLSDNEKWVSFIFKNRPKLGTYTENKEIKNALAHGSLMTI